MKELVRNKRIESIDILRGLAMVIMALDHVRDFFHISANIDDPLNLATTSPALYFTRWITHFCAPIFVFLSGTSIYLQSLRKSTKELGIFLVKRGIWLILAEWFIISLAWTFNPFYNVFPFQVIWAIGISMLILGLLILIKLPFRAILVLGLLIVFGHNLLDTPESKPGFQPGFWWDLVHHGRFTFYEFSPGYFVIVVYPFLAWTGVMMLGYAAGRWFSPNVEEHQRKKILLGTGSALILFFIVIRMLNVYGDPLAWSAQKNSLYSILSFLKVNKYPPSLLYLCITIGPALLLLAWMENWRNTFSRAMIVFGRTAFFYYIIHLYLIHVLATIAYFWRGHQFSELKQHAGQTPFLFVLPGEGFGLIGVYAVWLFVIVLLYPLCRRYDRYKSAHKEKWWLSYL